jgi:hypothetical protein
MGIGDCIVPQDRAFYDLLDKESHLILQGALMLKEAVRKFDAKSAPSRIQRFDE